MVLSYRYVIATLCVLAAAPASAQQCGGDFSAWRSALASQAQSQGVGERGLSALSGAQPNARVVRMDRAQGVFTQDFIEFSSRMVNDYRLQHGAANLEKYASIFERAEREFGVPGPVITAFWALETDFGAVQGDFSTLDALATLAHDCRRPELFRPQLISLLTLIDQGTLPANVEGAWAGEIGQVQVLPSDYLEKGVDGDGDGRVDLRSSPPDVIMTTANMLHSLGWRPGEPWMMEVQVPESMPWEETGRVNRLPIAQWSDWGVTGRAREALDPGLPSAGLVLPMGRKGPAFLLFPNFDVYLEWNKSMTYTLTAAYLGTRLAGAPSYDRRNPEPGLTAEEMKQLQQKLAAKGHDVGGIDGILGMGTREAVRREQMRLGFAVDGWPTRSLLSAL
ncbi:lytic murein transglycosylase [Mesorhizobium xinjiangense]|uniref:lytic murein transglycosylase n=1 Tax=Mesorhizobium xinjiangense TaxID=2678685 RepID=UPI0012EE22B3|nr:lytic murein transglycosylase [Mesorhizobium xinjiangense]